jgi:hypothetical protein
MHRVFNGIICFACTCTYQISSLCCFKSGESMMSSFLARESVTTAGSLPKLSFQQPDNVSLLYTSLDSCHQRDLLQGRKEGRKKGRKEGRKELCGNYLDDWPFRIASFSQCLEIQGCLDSIAHVRVLDRSSQQDRMRIKMSKEAHTERDRQLLYSSAYSQTT